MLNQMLKQMLNPKHGQHDVCVSATCWPPPQVGNMMMAEREKKVTEQGLLNDCETPCTRTLDDKLWPTPTTPARDGPGTGKIIIYPGQASRTRNGCVLLKLMAGKLCMCCTAQHLL